MTTGFIMQTLIYVISMEFLSLRRRRSPLHLLDAVFQNKQWYSVAPDDTYTLSPFFNNVFTSTVIFREISYLQLYYYMRNFCSLIGLEQWYFSLIWETYMWKLQPFAGSSINKIIITWFVRDIWPKYHWWYLKIVSNFTR